MNTKLNIKSDKKNMNFSEVYLKMSSMRQNIHDKAWLRIKIILILINLQPNCKGIKVA